MTDTSGVVDLDSLVGSTTLVLLFCDDELPELTAALSGELAWYESKGVQVVLVPGGGSTAPEPHGAPVLNDHDGQVRERYWPGAHAWPATVLLGGDGTIVARVEGGAPDIHLERLREAVAAHVGSSRRQAS